MYGRKYALLQAKWAHLSSNIRYSDKSLFVASLFSSVKRGCFLVRKDKACLIGNLHKGKVCLELIEINSQPDYSASEEIHNAVVMYLHVLQSVRNPLNNANQDKEWHRSVSNCTNADLYSTPIYNWKWCNYFRNYCFGCVSTNETGVRPCIITGKLFVCPCKARQTAQWNPMRLFVIAN